MTRQTLGRKETGRNMANQIKGDSGRVPVTSAMEVRHLAGPVTDHTVIEILDMQPTLGDLETAALHARGQVGRLHASAEGLSGAAALLYEALMRDELYQNEER